MISATLITKVSFVLFVLSYSGLVVIDSHHEVDLYPLEELKITDLNKNVRVQGKITSQVHLGETLFLTITNSTVSINVISFYAENKIQSQGTIEVVGRLGLENNELQIIASEIRTIR